MGVDFVRKAAKSFHKGLDRARIELATPDLFTQQPNCEPRSYVAEIFPGKKLNPGEEVGVHHQDGKIVVIKGLEPVANFLMPTAELLQGLEDSYDEAYGTVEEVYEDAGIAEITVC